MSGPAASTDRVLEHSTNFDSLKQEQRSICTVERLSIAVDGSSLRGFLHIPGEYSKDNPDRVSSAAILLSGAGGGVAGPASIYISMGDKLASLQRGIPVLRLDYRKPAQTEPCVKDVIAAMDFLDQEYSIGKFALVGWSFGGAPVFTVAAEERGKCVCLAHLKHILTCIREGDRMCDYRKPNCSNCRH